MAGCKRKTQRLCPHNPLPDYCHPFDKGGGNAEALAESVLIQPLSCNNAKLPISSTSHSPFDCHQQPKPLLTHRPQQKAIVAASHHHTEMVTIEGPSPHVSALGYLLGRRGEALTTMAIDPPCPPRCVILGRSRGSNNAVAATTTMPSSALTTSSLA